MLLRMSAAPPVSPVSRRWTVGLLLLLTFVTGLVDAVSFLKLGQVFVANMTGNITFLGLSVHPDAEVSPASPLAALCGFGAGAFVAGRAASLAGHRPRRWLGTAFGVEAGVLALVAWLTAGGILPVSGDDTLATVVVLATALGVQNGTVHHLAVHDLTTTVLTLALAGVVTDSQLARGAQPHRRLGSIAVMLVGAGTGAALLSVSVSLVLALAGTAVAVVAVGFALTGVRRT
ncbi:YoaK family protein [Saccharomonospora piscinae]|nr:YoaK family protein [Saccharomonospora piscinae]